MTTHELATVIEALRAGDIELVRLRANELVEWLEELQRFRAAEPDAPPPCSTCAGSGQIVTGPGQTELCADCQGEKIRRAGRA